MIGTIIQKFFLASRKASVYGCCGAVFCITNTRTKNKTKNKVIIQSGKLWKVTPIVSTTYRTAAGVGLTK